MKTFFAAIAAALLSFAAVPAAAETIYTEVTVTYRERIALPPDAELELSIQDVSRADAPAKTITFARIPIQRVPVTVRLGVDEAQIDERLSYTVRGQIYSGDEVLFRSTTATPVFTRGAGDEVDLLLEAAAPPAQAAGIAGVEWRMSELGGRLYVADDPPTLVFEENGTFALYGGCNRFTGKAELGDGTIDFPDVFAGTKRLCAEQRMKLEQDMLSMVAQATGYVRNGSLLTLTNEAGVSIARFNL